MCAETLYLCLRRFIEKHFDEFEDLFALDPLLLRLFIYICPKKDLFSLFEHIPTVLSTIWLTSMGLYANKYQVCSTVNLISGGPKEIMYTMKLSFRPKNGFAG